MRCYLRASTAGILRSRIDRRRRSLSHPKTGFWPYHEQETEEIGEGSVYNGVKVFDVHSHVSVPPASNAFLASLMASNTAMRSPLSQGGRTQVSEEEFRAAAARHLAYMDDRDIDVQIIGPRPFMQLGFMAPHLIESWARYVN